MKFVRNWVLILNPLKFRGFSKMIGEDKVIYSLNIEDVQNVALDLLGRKLEDNELSVIENKVGNYIDWFQAIETAIIDNIKD